MSRSPAKLNMKREAAAKNRPVETAARKYRAKQRARNRSHWAVNARNKLEPNLEHSGHQQIERGLVGLLFPFEIDCADPRSQKRDLGHPSVCWRLSRFACLLLARGGRCFLTFPDFSFFSTRSFQAVCSAPASMSSFAAAKRMWVAPFLPHPPATGKNKVGCSSTNMACCSGDSIRLPYPWFTEASVAKILPPTRKSAAPMCEPSSAPSRSSANRRKSFAVMSTNQSEIESHGDPARREQQSQNHGIGGHPPSPPCAGTKLAYQLKMAQHRRESDDDAQGD